MSYGDPYLSYESAASIGAQLGGVIIRIKSHRARDNARDVVSMRGLLSTKWVLYSRHSASDGFALVSPQDAGKLKAQTSRWSRSISYPKRVPADLNFRTGGIFG